MSWTPSFGCAVVLLCPCLAAADTRLVRHEGRCDLTRHDKIQNALKETLPDGRMTYGIRIRCGPFPGADWAIVAPLIVDNPTKHKLYCQFYIAFFDARDRLVGCCGQGTEVNASAKGVQFGSCIIHGPRTGLLGATRYQAVVYESDAPIGAEPVSAQDAARLPGAQKAVITKLVQTGSDVVKKDGHGELRLSADCSFHEPAKGSRNTHLQIKSEAEYDVYLSATENEPLITRPGKTPLKLPPLWSMNAEIELRGSPQGLASRSHLALLDAQGKLVACVQRPFRTMEAPKDRLLAARHMRFVAYEWLPAPRK